MGRAEWKKMLEYHRGQVALLQAMPPSCSSCSHYTSRDRMCAKFNAAPPEDIMLDGCDEWDMDSIPF